jgi:hypothetical protein
MIDGMRPLVTKRPNPQTEFVVRMKPGKIILCGDKCDKKTWRQGERGKGMMKGSNCTNLLSTAAA